MAIDASARYSGICLLGDNLDAALAVGEDLLTEKVTLADTTLHQPVMARLARQNREIAEFVSNVRTLELTMTARLLQARRSAENLKRSETRLKPLITLFVAGTASLANAADELGDTSAYDFQTADGPSAFLRGRGLIAPDAAGLERLEQLAITEDYLVLGRIRLGTLMDLVATFLDTLDLLFDIYAGSDSPAAPVGAVDAQPTGSSRAT